LAVPARAPRSRRRARAARAAPSRLEAAAMIAAHGLGFQYGQRVVLAGIEVAARSGQGLGVLGANGAGKTTRLRLLAGFLRPNTGSVLVEDAPIASRRQRERARLVAVVPQETPVDFPFTVSELVLLGRTAYLPPLGFEAAADLAAADRAMHACGVEE